MEEAAWELSKENIQPLKQGRQPTLLAKGLRVSSANVPTAIASDSQNADSSTNSSATVRALILQQEKQEFEESLKQCMNNEDPLAVYYKYIRWIEETHPSGKEKEIRDLVNRCLKSLNEPKWMQRYANDIRWLYIWLKFASFSRNMGSLTVYNFMEQNGHCVGLAGFYLRWAEELETAGHFDEAAKVFQSGIRKEAQPPQHLITAYEEFQVRYVRKLREMGSNDDEEDATRNVLGVLKAAPALHVKDPPVGTPFMRISTAEKVKCSIPKGITSSTTSKAQFSIYDENGSAEGGRRPTSILSAIEPQGFTSDHISCKENIQNAGVWTKAKINQPMAIPESQSSKNKQSGFSIYVDDSSKTTAPAKGSAVTSKGNRLAAKLAPLKSVCASNDEPAFACCLVNIYNGSKEMSFEELRAIRWTRKGVVRQQRPDPVMGQTTNNGPSSRQAFAPVMNGPDSPSGNTSFTQNIYREARAAFSNTLRLSTIGRSGEVDEETGSVAPLLSAAPKDPAGANGFLIYEDSVANQENAEFNIEREFDKENIDPKRNQGEKKRRSISGVLCESVEFPCSDENKDDVIIVEEDEDNGVVDPAPRRSVGNNVSTTFDFNETTVAGLHRFLPPTGTRAFSTPCHNLSRIQPLSLSMYKPGEALDFANVDPGTDLGIGENEYRQNLVSGGERLTVNVISKVADGKNAITQKLSAIAETSREYRSSSTSGSSATVSSTGNNRGRALSGASGVHTLPSINEIAAEIRSTLAFNTPYSDAGMPYTLEIDDAIDSQGKLKRGTMANDGETKCGIGTQPSGAVRKLFEDEDAGDQERLNAGNVIPNPWDPAFIEYQLSTMPRLESYPNYHTFDEKVPALEIGGNVCLGGEIYSVMNLVGEGAFAKVYRCQLLDQESDADVVLKVQKPRCPIEFSICEELHRRLKSQNLIENVEAGLNTFNEAYMFVDGSILVSEYSPYGTLIDLVNVYKQLSSEKSLPEVIVAYLTSEILRILEATHGQNIIHGDVKPDNFLVLDSPSLDLKAQLSEIRSVRLIDWGRSIDTAFIPPTTTFLTRSGTSGFVCCEMQDGQPWTFQTDYFGMLGTVHVLAFGTYMSVYKLASVNRWRVNSTFKRRWDDHLWRDFFDTFLNVPNCSTLPCLGEWRRRFEDFVNVQRSNRPNCWISEVQKMRDVLVELKRTKSKKKKLA